MDNSRKILECVPNFSEGNDDRVINAIAAAIERVNGQSLLHIDKSPSANRTVYTFAGDPEAVTEAAFAAIKTATELIDMRRQSGAHPRLGATDVCPLIPLGNMAMKEAVYWSEQLASRVNTSLKIPVYLYEYSARQAYRRALPDIRKGQYEGLFHKLKQQEWQPDYGNYTEENELVIQKAGAAIIGARDILVAFNISLDTRDEKIAKAIAQQLRTSGYSTKDKEQHITTHHTGLLPAVRAIGWYLEDFDCAQVSMNLLDYRTTSPLKAWEACRSVAAQYNVALTGCEVVGLIPETCVAEAGIHALNPEHHKSYTQPIAEEIIQAGINYLGLDRVKPFNPEEKILEYALRRKGVI